VLLLFDIDGTLLIKAAGAHADALRAALEEVWAVPDASAVKVETAGRTDPEIARLMLGELGVPADRIDAGMPAFQDACAREYARRVPADLSDRVAPGVPELLERLAARDDVTLSLVTGNLEPVARAKLGAAGIGHFFAPGQGGFGSDHEHRAELPAIARRRAGDHPREDTIVIGDTPRDIACARADGVRVVAVATGPHPPDELGEADGVARTAHELGPLLDDLAA
jgi:phosphoglycolate phosphatase-like HAD superfamily hydrolase